MAINIRFVDPLPIPEAVVSKSAHVPTILQIAPCLGETGKRLLDAGELYQLFLALVEGVIPLPFGGGVEVVAGPGDVILPPGASFVPVRQKVPQSINITLPTPVSAGFPVLIKDAVGACATVVFTINTRDGTLIDLQPTFNIAIPFQSQMFVFDGTGWTING